MQILLDLPPAYPVPIAEIPPDLRLRIVGSKCGVMLEGLHPVAAMQGDLFATADPRAPQLRAAIDDLNDRYGRSTVRLAAEGQGARATIPSVR